MRLQEMTGGLCGRMIYFQSGNTRNIQRIHAQGITSGSDGEENRLDRLQGYFGDGVEVFSENTPVQPFLDG